MPFVPIIEMITLARTFCVGIAGAALLHWAAPAAFGLTIDDLGVVGIVDANDKNTPSDPENEFEFAQIIFDLSANEVQNGVGDYLGLIFKASKHDYAATLDASLLTDPANSSLFMKTEYGNADGETPLSGDFVDIPDGYEYAMAKYDGKNAGWVLFALNDVTTDGIPVSSASIWTNDQEEGYEISHLTAFNVSSVPDGGSVLAMLGASLLGLAWFRSRTGARASRVA